MTGIKRVALYIALVCFIQAAPVSRPLSQEKDSDPSKVLDQLYEIMVYAERTVNYRYALTIALQIYSFMERSNNEQGAIIYAMNIGYYFKQLGQFEQAENAYDNALKRAVKTFGEASVETAGIEGNLASLYFSMGKYSKCKEFAGRAAEKLNGLVGDRDRRTIIQLRSLGSAYHALERNGEAEAILSRALALSIEALGGDDLETVYIRENLSVVHSSLGRRSEAMQNFREVLHKLRVLAGEDHPRTANAMNSLGVALLDDGALDEAEALVRRAADIRARILRVSHPDTLSSWLTLSLVLIEKAKYREAESLLKKVVSTTKDIASLRPLKSAALTRLGLLYHKWGKYKLAERQYLLAISLIEKMYGADHRETAATIGNLIALYAASQQYDKAVAWLQRINVQPWVHRELVEASGRVDLRSAAISGAAAKHLALTIAIQFPNSKTLGIAANATLQWKDVGGEQEALLERIIRLPGSTAVNQDLARQILALRATIGDDFRDPNRIQGVRESLKRLGDLERELRKLSSEFDDINKNVNFEDIQKTLAKNSVFLDFNVYVPWDFKELKVSPVRLSVLVIRSEGIPALVDLGPLSEVEGLVDVAIGSRGLGLNDWYADELYRKVFGKIDSIINDRQTLIISPDGLLNLVPFEALRLADGRWLMERHQRVQIVKSGRDLIAAGRESKGGGLVAVGGVDYNGSPLAIGFTDEAKCVADSPPVTWQKEEAGYVDTLVKGGFLGAPAFFQPLPGSLVEARSVATFYSKMRGEEAKVFCGRQVHADVFRSFDRPPRVLHLATHGFVFDLNADISQPLLLSGIALSGANLHLKGERSFEEKAGILRAIEVAGLDLEGTELVVLSACDSGRGAHDKSGRVYSLGYAFQLAGVRYVLVTLWPVGDDSGREFVELFYKNWLTSAEPDVVSALSRTKNEFNEKGYDPGTWAPYVLLGR